MFDESSTNLQLSCELNRCDERECEHNFKNWTVCNLNYIRLAKKIENYDPDFYNTSSHVSRLEWDFFAKYIIGTFKHHVCSNPKPAPVSKNFVKLVRRTLKMNENDANLDFSNMLICRFSAEDYARKYFAC